MTATPEKTASLTFPDAPTVKSSILNRDSLNYLTTVGLTIGGYHIGVTRLYDLGYFAIEKLTNGADMSIMNNTRNALPYLTVAGGWWIGDMLYNSWKRSKPS